GLANRRLRPTRPPFQARTAGCGPAHPEFSKGQKRASTAPRDPAPVPGCPTTGRSPRQPCAPTWAAPRRRNPGAAAGGSAEMNPFVAGMVLVRLLSSAVELSAAVLMARYNRVDTALRINGILGLVGP